MNDLELLSVARLDRAFEQMPTLSQAIACADCEAIFRFALNNRCPICTSRALLNLSSAINRKPRRPLRWRDLLRLVRRRSKAN